MTALLSLLEGAVFTENDLDAILDGELRPRKPPANGLLLASVTVPTAKRARVAALARWLAEGRAPHAWTDAK